MLRKIIYKNKKLLSFNQFCSLSQPSIKIEPPTSTNDPLETKNDSLYPPIKPKYPPGKWKSFSPESAWKINEKSHEILLIPKAKERLEALAGEEEQVMWLVKPFPSRPYNLDFIKTITRSEIIQKIPEEFEKINVEKYLGKSLNLIQRFYEQEMSDVLNHSFQNVANFDKRINKLKSVLVNYEDENKTKLDFQTENFFHLLLSIFPSLLSHHCPHLSSSELDINSRVESFWRVFGFHGEDKIADGSWDLARDSEGKDLGVLHFQFKNQINFQIRSHFPLIELLPHNDPICSYSSFSSSSSSSSSSPPMPSFSPEFINLPKLKQKPTNVSGSWLGGKCDFVRNSVTLVREEMRERFESYEGEAFHQMVFSSLLSTMFGASLAQAHNHGFCDLLDVTYPLTTQALLVTNNEVYFGWFQLNSLQLWNDANLSKNIVFISNPIQISNDGKINEKFCEYFLKFLLLPSKNKSHSLRPYLPEDDVQKYENLLINFKNEPLFEQPKIGRFQYPKNSIYF